MSEPNRFIAAHEWLSLYAGDRNEPYVVASPGVLIVALNYAQEVLFTLEPTAPTGEIVINLPGGTIDAGETPAQTAQRELQEETGYRAEKLDDLGLITPLARSSAWDVHVFLAQGLMPARRLGDEVYEIEVERVKLAAFEPLIAAGRLRDAPSIAALFLARAFLAGQYRRGQADD